MKDGLIGLLFTVLLWSCSSENNKAELLEIHIPKDAVVAYISKPKVKLFKTPDAKSSTLMTLSLGDSVYVQCNGDMPCDYFGNFWYTTFAVKNKKAILGYIEGKNIGKGFFSDIDNDKVNELFIASYKNYKEETEKDLNWKNPAHLLVVKKRKIISNFNFQGYSTIWLESLGNRGFPDPNKFFILHYGLEACDYDNAELLLQWNGNNLRLISEKHGSAGEYAGLSFDYIFPADTNGKPDEIKIIESLTINNPEEAEPGDKDESDTSIYKYKNGIFSLFYKSKHHAE